MKLSSSTQSQTTIKRHAWQWLAVCVICLGFGSLAPMMAQQTTPAPEVPPVRRDANRALRQLHPLQRLLAQQMRVILQLDLTDEQRAQIRAILPRHNEAWQRLNAETRQARAAYQRALMNPVPVAPEVLAECSRTLGQVETAWAELVGKVWYEVRQTLTPEQFARLRQLRLEQMRRRAQQNLTVPEDNNAPLPNSNRPLRGRPRLNPNRPPPPDKQPEKYN